MPRRDGTGPIGQGTMTGRGLGFCSGADTRGSGFGIGRKYGCGLGFGMGAGNGCRKGFGRYFAGQVTETINKDRLTKERDFLQNRLDEIKKLLDQTE